ncbi:uncharacterized protein LOC121404947 [Drosophila obscura]|uniref:uncharacterized protein LOC121404947 n=1 Tax=Drosophila obscura TaxID=7282 RepID=UPI001BB199FF|nr:uncharacterized protein LOC121404947 [Drosophila obscura]
MSGASAFMIGAFQQNFLPAPVRLFAVSNRLCDHIWHSPSTQQLQHMHFSRCALCGIRSAAAGSDVDALAGALFRLPPLSTHSGRVGLPAPFPPSLLDGDGLLIRTATIRQASHVSLAPVAQWKLPGAALEPPPVATGRTSLPLSGTMLMDGAKSIRIFFQNIAGMRTKAQAVYLATSTCDFDVIILVETWLNENFFDNEYFDPNLFQVFRKDRDCAKTKRRRGGGVIVAVRRTLRCDPICLLDGDSILDQIGVSVAGQSETLCISASYIPPNSSYEVYKAHTLNIANIYGNLRGRQHLCVVGDFNLGSLVWSADPQSAAMMPSNAHLQHEVLFLDDCYSMGLTQINNVFNSSNFEPYTVWHDSDVLDSIPSVVNIGSLDVSEVDILEAIADFDNSTFNLLSICFMLMI